MTVKELIRHIERLPEDEIRHVKNKWYLTQKEHWLGWLGEYDGPGYYGRQTGLKRDARFAYNHIVCPDMLLYLARAIPLAPEVVAEAEAAFNQPGTMMKRAGAIRKIAPWEQVEAALRANPLPPTLWEKLFSRKPKDPSGRH